MFLPRTPTYKIVLYQSSDSQKINKRREVVRHNENTDEEVFLHTAVEPFFTAS